MRTYEEILTTAHDERPFSNGTEAFGWMENWCYAPCHNPIELAWQRYVNGQRKTAPRDYPGGCPLLQMALLGKTPTEWLRQELGPDKFHCIEFRGPDDGHGDDPFGGPPARPPRAKCEPDDMDGLFPRPDRRVRMLKQRQDEPVFA